MATLNIVSPVSDSPVKAGEKGKIIVLLENKEVWDTFSSVKVYLNNSGSNCVWSASKDFSSNEADIEITFPTQPGKYTLVAKCLGLLGQVRALAQKEFTISS